MDSKFVVIIGIFFGMNVILVQAEKELNNPRIFTISGSTQFRRHHHLKIDPAAPIKIDESARSLLKKYLIIKSRQESEFLDTEMKKRDARPLSLQAAFVKVLRKNFFGMNVHYENLIRAVQSTSVCFPLPKEDPGDAVYFTDDLESADRHKKDYTPKIRIEQRVTLNDLEIRGTLMEANTSSANRYNFHLSLDNPRLKTVYVRMPTSQGVVTKSMSEVLTCQSITMNITHRGVILVKSVNVSQNMQLMAKMAEVWLVPVMEAIKNQYSLAEILYQSKVYFRKYLRDLLQRFTDEVLSAMDQLISFKDSEDMEADNEDLIKFLELSSHNFKLFHVSYYDSVTDPMVEGSCNQYAFVHIFHMKFESTASVNYPLVQYFGVKKVAEKGAEGMDHVVSDKIPVKELSLKFEIHTDKAGIPITMTRLYKVNLKLKIDDANPEKLVHLRVQEKLEKLMTEYYGEKINNIIFGSTPTDE